MCAKLCIESLLGLFDVSLQADQEFKVIHSAVPFNGVHQIKRVVEWLSVLGQREEPIGDPRTTAMIQQVS